MKLFFDVNYYDVEINGFYRNLMINDVHKLKCCCLGECIEIEVDEEDYIGLNGCLIHQLPIWVIIGKFNYNHNNYGKILYISPLKIGVFTEAKRLKENPLEDCDDFIFEDVEVKMFMVSY